MSYRQLTARSIIALWAYFGVFCLYEGIMQGRDRVMLLGMILAILWLVAVLPNMIERAIVGKRKDG